jgi:hypothetical protein
MTLGKASQQGDLFDPVTKFCDETLGVTSIFGFLHRGLPVLFPDVLFADLFVGTGRRSVPPSVVAVVMVLQRLEGLSDREAVDRFTFDARWRYAAGVGGWDGDGRVSFAHTVLVDMRERLRRSADPDRVFTVALAAAAQAGLVGRRRVLDSTPLYDAVATMDTITLIRSAIRGLLVAADDGLEAELRARLTSGDDYRTAGKPTIDWDDRAAQADLIDSRACDGDALLTWLENRMVSEAVYDAAQLLATILGQDLEVGDGRRFRIARRVAPNRIISTVDPHARHGHKTNHRGYDGYKAHIAIDPDSEIITATAVSSPGTGDAVTAVDLLDDITPDHHEPDHHEPDHHGGGGGQRFTVYGDSAYGSAELLTHLDTAGAEARTKVQKPVAPGGHYTKDAFAIDLDTATVTCPAGIVAAIRPLTGHDRHAAAARFATACTACPLAAQCTTSKTGRVITIGHHEARLTAARTAQTDPGWQADYRAVRPKVERKIAHLMRRRHGGRRARMRGTDKIAADFQLLAAATNLARLAILGLTHQPTGWTTA